MKKQELEKSSIKFVFRNNSFDIRKKQAVEIGRYECENVKKNVLYRDQKGYFLEECNICPAIDECNEDIAGVLVSRYYPMGIDLAYAWAVEGHCDPGVLLAEFYDDDPEDVELVKKKAGEEENLLTITGHRMAIIITPNGESVFMYLSSEVGSFPVNKPNSKMWCFEKLFESYEITEEEEFEDLSDILSESQKKEQLYKVLLSKPEVEKISGTKYCINGYIVIAMNCFE